MKLGRTLRQRASAGHDLVAFGENSLDTIAIGRGPWREVGKQPLADLVERPGGQAASAAVGVARLGWRARYVGVIGDDEAGALVKDTLTHEGVDVLAVTRTSVPTRRAVVLVDEKTGERTVLEHRDPALACWPGEVADDVFRQTRILLVDGSDPPASLRAARLAQAAGVRTLVDVDRPGEAILELLRFIDLVVVPEAALAALTGLPDLGRSLAALGQRLEAAAIVATLGADGALAWCRGREIRVPGCAVDVVDTTGAGDAFRAGLAAAWLGRGAAEPDLEDLLRDANRVASLSCRGLGAQTALPYASEVPEHLRGGV